MVRYGIEPSRNGLVADLRPPCHGVNCSEKVIFSLFKSELFAESGIFLPEFGTLTHAEKKV
jgi:hypothetical protein